jgi:hypothetical protein
MWWEREMEKKMKRKNGLADTHWRFIFDTLDFVRKISTKRL